MEYITILSGLILTLMSISFPLMLSIIRDIQKQYKSVTLSHVFLQEKDYKRFHTTLNYSVIVLFVWIICRIIAFDSGNIVFHKIIGKVWHSYMSLRIEGVPEVLYQLMNTLVARHNLIFLLDLVLFLTSAYLVYRFMKLITLIKLYYDPNKLTDRLMDRNIDLVDVDFTQRLLEVQEVVAATIGSNTMECKRALIEKVQNFRLHECESEKEKSILVVIRMKIFRKLVENYSDDISGLLLSILNGFNEGLIRGEKIVVDEYGCAWNHISELINKGLDDLFMDYWGTMNHKVADFYDPIYVHTSIFSYPEAYAILIKWVNELNDKRKDFGTEFEYNRVLETSFHDEHQDLMKNHLKLIQYHLSMCALILHCKRYSLLKRVLNYSISQPPHYYLYPSTFNEIFLFYLLIHDTSSFFYLLTLPTPCFPGYDGIQVSDGSISCVRRFLALLYLRLFTLRCYTNNQTFELPPILHDLHLLGLWKEEAASLKRDIEYLLKQSEIQDQFSLTDNPQAAEKAISSLETFIINIGEQIDHNRASLLLSEDIVEKIRLVTTVAILKLIKRYKQIHNTTDQGNTVYSYPVILHPLLYPKSVFEEVEDYWIGLITHDHISQMSDTLYSMFIGRTKKKYLIPIDRLFEAVNKLKLPDNKYVILTINLILNYMIDIQKIQGLSQNDFQGTTLFQFNNSVRRTEKSLFVIRKIDLPWVELSSNNRDDALYQYQSCSPDNLREYIRNCNGISNKNIEMVDFDNLIEQHPIKVSILDLNNKPDIRKKIPQICNYLNVIEEQELKESLLITIKDHIIFKIKTNPEIIHLSGYIHNPAQGLPNSFDEIPRISEIE